MVKISGFDPFSPQKLYHSMLFKDGANEIRSAHIYTVTPSNRMTMECRVMHGETCENPVSQLQLVPCYHICYSLFSQVAFTL